MSSERTCVLREMRVSDNRFDREHVAEEIEDLGKSERDAMRSQIRRIIEHLLKLAFSPEPPRFAWMETILDARQALSDKMSPSLRRDAEASLGRLFADARKRAEASLSKYGEPEAAAAMPQICPFSLDDICREDWYPERPGAQP